MTYPGVAESAYLVLRSILSRVSGLVPNPPQVWIRYMGISPEYSKVYTLSDLLL